MKRILLTLAIAFGLVVGSAAIFTADTYACGGMDKDSSTEDTSESAEPTES